MAYTTIINVDNGFINLKLTRKPRKHDQKLQTQELTTIKLHYTQTQML